MPLALHARALWKSYAAGVEGCSARIWVLRGVSLDVEQGECVAVLGARGAGTTTLLHCLAGLRRADAGTVDRRLATTLVDRWSGEPAGQLVHGGALVLWDDRTDASPPLLASAVHEHRRGRGALVIAARELARIRHVADRVLWLREGGLTPIDRASGIRRVAERRPGGGPSLFTHDALPSTATSGTRAPERPGTAHA
jgi:ABC-type taurine transport system ATPase subunit